MSLFQATSLAQYKAAQHSVHPTGGSLRVFRQFVWLGVGSVKMAFSHPAHQRVTQTVSLHYEMIMENFVVSSVLLLLLVGCAPLQQPAQLPTNLTVEFATNTLIATQEGLTEYQTKRVATVLAIRTASTTPLPTRTLTLTPTMDPDPTNIAKATQVAASDQYCDGIPAYFYNDTWGICDRDSHKFILFNLDGRVWHYSYEQLGVAREGEGPEYWTSAMYWTKDGRYAYLKPFPVGYDPLGPFLGNATALFKVDLEDGAIESILPPHYFYSISISPTGRYLAYVMFGEPLELVIQDLQSDEIWQMELEPRYTQAGAFDWSTDELKVTYTLFIDGDECTREFAIRLVSIRDMRSTAIIDDTKVDTCQPTDPTYYVVDVTGESVILDQHGDIWVYKIASQQLSLQATATPTP